MSCSAVFVKILSSPSRHSIFWAGCRFSCITQVHVKRGIKVTAARKSLIMQATCNWNTSSSFKCSKISQQVFQSFSNQGDSVWFCYSLQRSWHFRSKWNLVIQEKEWIFRSCLLQSKGFVTQNRPTETSSYWQRSYKNVQLQTRFQSLLVKHHQAQ